MISRGRVAAMSFGVGWSYSRAGTLKAGGGTRPGLSWWGAMLPGLTVPPDPSIHHHTVHKPSVSPPVHCRLNHPVLQGKDEFSQREKWRRTISRSKLGRFGATRELRVDVDISLSRTPVEPKLPTSSHYPLLSPAKIQKEQQSCLLLERLVCLVWIRG